ncbi:M56 family metallopeptidase [Spirosoma areae]
MTSLPYLLKASLFLLLFYGCYGLLLRRNTFFGLNRAYLLTSVMLSLLLPFVELPDRATKSLPVGSITLPTFVVGTAPQTPTDGLTTTQWILLLYGIGVVLMLVRLGLNLWAVHKLIQRGTSERNVNYTLIRLPDDRAPSFSFGRCLVLNQTDGRTEPDALIRHEEAHIRQGHTADVLFLEIAQAIFWFNPVLIFYKRAVQEVHEFLADRAVCSRASTPPAYVHQLVAYALNVTPAELITPFVSKSTLKQRIVMLQKPQTHRRALLRYALALPLATLLVMCTQPDRDQPQSEAGQARLATPNRVVKVQGKIYDAVEESPQFPGGIEKLYEYLSKNLKYPEAAQKVKAEGRVMVRFVLTKEGDITNVQILKGIGYGADEEAARVVSQMPRWTPAKQDGKAVNVQYHLPINFQLEDKEWEAAAKGKKSAFFSFPLNDADIRKAYKHFVVNGKEVAFDEFSKYSKADVVEASSSKQLMRIETR